MAFNLLRYFEGAQPNKKRKESELVGTQTEKKKKYELEIRDRQFKPQWKNGRSWLFYDEELNTMKCSLCKEHGHPGKISKSWVQGTQNFKIDTVKFHEKSLAHIDAEKSQKIQKIQIKLKVLLPFASCVEDAAAAILLNDFDYEIESDSESSEPEIDNEQIELEIEKEREIVLDN